MPQMIHGFTRWRDVRMRICADDEGIRALLPGGEWDTLAALQAMFPSVRMEEGKHPAFDQVLEYLEGTAAQAPPLLPNGTAFRKTVWSALMEIPLGRTSSYAAVAARIGNPGAVRAVAAACGVNPVAILIPCHRVIRSDGSLSGYRWGVGLKAKLLEWERGVNPCA